MRDDFRRLAHAGLTFNAPVSEERASALVSRAVSVEATKSSCRFADNSCGRSWVAFIAFSRFSVFLLFVAIRYA